MLVELLKLLSQISRKKFNKMMKKDGAKVRKRRVKLQRKWTWERSVKAAKKESKIVQIANYPYVDRGRTRVNRKKNHKEWFN